MRVTGDRPLLHRNIVFMLRSGISRRNNAPSPVTRDPRARGCAFLLFCRKFVTGKRVTAGTGPCYCCVATWGRSNVTWFRPPVTRAILNRPYYTIYSMTCQEILCIVRTVRIRHCSVLYINISMSMRLIGCAGLPPEKSLFTLYKEHFFAKLFNFGKIIL